MDWNKGYIFVEWQDDDMGMYVVFDEDNVEIRGMWDYKHCFVACTVQLEG